MHYMHYIYYIHYTTLCYSTLILHTYIPTYLPTIHTYIRTYVRTYVHTYIHVGGKKIYMHISNDIDIDIYIHTPYALNILYS